MNERKIVVRTELTGKLMADFNTTSLLRLWWFFIPSGLFLIASGTVLCFSDNSGETVLGILVILFGAFFCIGIFLLPQMLTKTEQKFIQPNIITLTFYDDILNVSVSGDEESANKLIIYENNSSFFDKAYKFRRDYRNENWKYCDIISCYASKKLFYFRLTFSDIIVFRVDQLIEGNIQQLKELLKEKMGKKFRGQKDSFK